MNIAITPFSSNGLPGFNTLTLEECKALYLWLEERIALLKQLPPVELAVSSLDLSARARNALIAHKLFTVKDVIAYGPDNVCRLRNIGQKTAQEIRDCITATMNKA